MRVLIAGIAAAALLIGVLAAVTAVGAWRIERSHAPAGKCVDVKGGRLHVLELDRRDAASPNGLPIVLLHGASGNLEDMRLALGERLSRRHRVILVDRPGHGFSERYAADGASPARQAAMVGEMLGRLGVERAVVVGHSFAGSVATALALDDPARVAGLVLISPAVHPYTTGTAWFNTVATIPIVGQLFAWTIVLPAGSLFLERGVSAVFAPQSAPADYAARAAIALVLRPSNFIANARDLRGLSAFLTTQAPRYPAIKVPAIIITGDRDVSVTPRIHSFALVKQLPHAKLVVLEGVGHMPHHVATDRVIDAIEEIAAGAKR
jgi:pimeloyl-ACP methyl ester carboxylesterase